MAEPGAQRGDGWIALAAAAIVLATVVGGAVLPGLLNPPRPSTPAAFDREPTCAEWTDGCVVCQRNSAGIACSTPGIACTREAPKCLRRQGA